MSEARSVLISHAAADSDSAAVLAAALRSSGVAVLEDPIPAEGRDQTFLEKINDSGVRDLVALVLLFSPASAAGTAAARYWGEAIADEAIHGRGWVLPVLIDECSLPPRVSEDLIDDLRDESGGIDASRLVERVGRLP